MNTCDCEHSTHITLKHIEQSKQNILKRMDLIDLNQNDWRRCKHFGFGTQFYGFSGLAVG